MTGTSPRRRCASFARVLLAAALPTIAPAVAAQTVPADPGPAIVAAAVAQADVQTGPPATLLYANRPIVELRASVFGRPPAARVAAARLAFDLLVDAGITGPVQYRPLDAAMAIGVGGRDLFLILPADVDPLAGVTLTETAALAASRLQTALNEAAELRRPRQMLAGVLAVLLATALFAVLAWLLRRARIAASRRIVDAAKRRLHASAVGDAEFVRSSRIAEFLHRLVTVLTWALALLFAYSWLTFGLRRFPYTRPWGESLREFLLGRLSQAGAAIVQALPGLFTVLLIVLLTRFVARILHLLIQAVEQGRASIPGLYPETAQPTNKILTVALWLFALAIAYPYLPGSGSEAFKGVSVFVGLVVSLGSSGLVNQVMSGLTLTYSRAFRNGDFVAVGNVEGTVMQVGTLSTKLMTARGEDVTIPNAVIVSQTVTNYSRFAQTEGVFVPAEITIGYEVPWRQVEALLLLAAARSSGVRREPAPVVRPAALEDAYVRYILLFCLEQPAERRKTLAAVHANILDAFNEYGVQITSPNYEADPAAPKVVPRDQWFAAPAGPGAPAARSASADAIRNRAEQT